MLTCPILYYHLISSPPTNQKNHSIYIPPERFDRHLSLLKRAGYRSIGLDELLDHLESGTRPPGRPMMITFDDGHIDNYTQAFPVLQRHAFSAAIFVIAGSIDGRLQLRCSVESNGESILTREQLRELAAGGIEIQSHGMTHADLPALDNKQVLWEMTESRKILEDIIEHPVKYFCYPFGRFKPHHFELAQEAGYRAAFSTFRGRRHNIDERWCLKRIPVHNDRSTLQFLSALWIKSYRRSEAKLKTVLRNES